MKLNFVLFSLSILLACTELTRALAEPATACFNVEGMTCTTCSVTVKTAVRKLDGIREVSASYGSKDASVSFDTKLTSVQKIKAAIDKAGYQASEKPCNNK